MVKLAGEEHGATKRLVLGFDAGCMTCSDLARRIEEQVGDKIEIRGLREPQVEHWREQALGTDAPWAPTLIEVDDKAVKAWTGVRMGARLSRILGPLATWRVMQSIGKPELNRRTEDSEQVLSGDSAALTRGQLLKGGLAGAVAGAGLLVGTDRLVPNLASAQSSPDREMPSQATSGQAPKSTGTRAEQSKAKEIVRSSGPYEKLAADQGVYNAPFNFEGAIVNVDGDYAGVAVASLHAQRSVVAIFLVDLLGESVGDVRTMELTPADRSQAARLVVQENFEDIENFSRVTLRQDHMVAEGRKMSYEKAAVELDKIKQNRAPDKYQLQQSGCLTTVGYLAGAIGAGGCYLACLALGVVTIGVGLSCAAACSIIGTTTTLAAQDCICRGIQARCPCTRCT